MKQMQGFFFHNFHESFIIEILQEIYKDRVYYPYIGNKSDLTILDVGANIGLASYYFSDYAEKVYAIEPAQMHFGTLTKMVEFNKLDNVQPIKLALGGKDGTMSLYHSNNATAYTLVNILEDGYGHEDVDVVTMSTLFERYGIKHVDFMKLDVEGVEGEIINSEAFESVCKNIDTIVGEHHKWATTSLDNLLTTLRDYGYKAEKLLVTDAHLFAATRL